jgi:hypothetical protein
VVAAGLRPSVNQPLEFVFDGGALSEQSHLARSVAPVLFDDPADVLDVVGVEVEEVAAVRGLEPFRRGRRRRVVILAEVAGDNRGRQLLRACCKSQNASIHNNGLDGDRPQ